MYRRYCSLAFVVLLASATGLAAQGYEAEVQTGLDFEAPTGTDCESNPDNVAANCGFETGSFAPWMDTDLGEPFYPLEVNTGGVDVGFGFFVSAPTQGSFATLNGFDGDGPGVIRVEQDVSLLNGADFVTFDYRAAWDMTFSATLPRTFEVHIEPSGGGAPMQTDLILQADPDTINPDTGNQTGMVDISSFAPGDVRLVFEWTIPEAFTGPGFFQLDNVNVNSPVPVELLEFVIDDGKR